MKKFHQGRNFSFYPRFPSIQELERLTCLADKEFHNLFHGVLSQLKSNLEGQESKNRCLKFLSSLFLPNNLKRIKENQGIYLKA